MNLEETSRPEDATIAQCPQTGHWRAVAASVAGSSHERSGKECEDATEWAVVRGDTIVAAVADGAGSAPLGGIGSGLVVHSLVAAVAGDDRLPVGVDEDAVWVGFVTKMLGLARMVLESEAERRATKMSDLATTVVLAVSTPETIAVAQVGDGVAVIEDRAGNVFALTTPQSGEYINETNFLTMPNALSLAQTAVYRGNIASLAIMSDGLQMLALNMTDHQPHRGFFTPLFRFVSAAAQDRAGDELANFLRSPRVRARTDDDVTLFLANWGK